ncbi:MAG: DUF2812 domain-containing protein [Eubacteriaceae bacterium]|nr:DUF2812 domain-containing protein [Eubacteriaceae bacterium]
MTERKTVYKWFYVWQFEEEELWLNEMAQEGWALEEVGWCRYTFGKSERGEYTIRLEMRPFDEGYVSFMEETGASYIGRVFQWIFFRRKSSLGPFDIYSDMDSKIAHLERISKFLSIVGFANLAIGVANSMGANRGGWLNLLCATVLMYALGRIHGKKESLEKERRLHE